MWCDDCDKNNADDDDSDNNDCYFDNHDTDNVKVYDTIDKTTMMTHEVWCWMTNTHRKWNNELWRRMTKRTPAVEWHVVTANNEENTGSGTTSCDVEWRRDHRKWNNELWRRMTKRHRKWNNDNNDIGNEEQKNKNDYFRPFVWTILLDQMHIKVHLIAPFLLCLLPSR